MFPVQTRVVFQQEMRCFYDTVDKKRMRGVVNLLKSAFWPKYSYRKTPKGPAEVKKHGVSARAGIARGKRVDKEVGLFISGTKVKTPHPFTCFALSALKKLNILPIASQVVVYDTSARLATAVDILGRAHDGTLCVIELKCSSDAKYSSPCGFMKGVFAERDDSLLQQHAVQCLVTHALFEKTYAARARAFVLRINAEGASMTRLPRDPNATKALAIL
jgi:hypothetical protein